MSAEKLWRRYQKLLQAEYQSVGGVGEPAALSKVVAESVAAERERCANCVPTNWCDSLLSGDAKVVTKKSDGLEVEALLMAIRKRIRATPARDEAGRE